MRVVIRPLGPSLTTSSKCGATAPRSIWTKFGAAQISLWSIISLRVNTEFTFTDDETANTCTVCLWHLTEAVINR